MQWLNFLGNSRGWTKRIIHEKDSLDYNCNVTSTEGQTLILRWEWGKFYLSIPTSWNFKCSARFNPNFVTEVKSTIWYEIGPSEKVLYENFYSNRLVSRARRRIVRSNDSIKWFALELVAMLQKITLHRFILSAPFNIFPNFLRV